MSNQIWSKVAIQNFGDTEWTAMVDDAGNTLTGIAGRAGVVGQPEGEREIGVDEIRIEPGCAFPLHTHPGAHILYVTQGQGYLHAEGRNRVIRAGDSVFVAAEFPHGVSNPTGSTGVLVFIAIGFPHKHVASPERMKIV